MRAFALSLLLVGCARGPAFKLDVTEAYEVGEDVTVVIRARPDVSQTGELVVTRPDGTIVQRPVTIDAELSRIRLGATAPEPGAEPTVTVPGAYTLQLRDGARVLASRALTVSRARLDQLIPVDVIADYKPVSRFTRSKQGGSERWKVYSALYEHAYRGYARVEVRIEDLDGRSDDAFARAWRAYADEGTRAMILDKPVRFIERTSSVSASWTSGRKIVFMKAGALEDLERGLIGYFLARFPSDL